jgi:hypothetical protein
MNTIWLGKNFYQNAKNDSFIYNIKTQKRPASWLERTDPSRMCTQAFYSVIISKLTAKEKKLNFKHHI